MNFFRNNSIYKNSNLITYTVDTAIDNNLSIYIQNGEIAVSAPWYLSKKQIQQKVLEKREWILNKLMESEIKKEKYFKNILIFGQIYEINILFKYIKSPEVNLKKQTIEIVLPYGYRNKDITNIMNLIINKIYMSIANEKIDLILEKIRLMMDIAPDNIELKHSKTILAKCLDNNIIIINPKIFQYQNEIIEYILIHEFCHLKYKNHTKSFYNMLKKYVPNYENLSKNIPYSY